MQPGKGSGKIFGSAMRSNVFPEDMAQGKTCRDYLASLKMAP